MLIDLICGARPNFIKIAPIVKELKKNRINKFRIIHTGQHYNTNMSKFFFDELQIPKPNFNLNVKSGTHSKQTSKIMNRYEEIILKKKPDLCIVVGDVNSTMACAIVAKKNNIKLAHVEAGLRSGDLTMPEEINRIVTDSLSDIFFTTSIDANKNLIKEGKKEKNIYFVGNTMIDTLINFKNKFKKPHIYKRYNLSKNSYFILTLHRPSNVDNKKNLMILINEISNSCKNSKIIFPVHPRLHEVFKNQSLINDNIILTKPLSYLNFLYLINNAKGVITDSGGLTEETTYLKIPCITLRSTTERPETISLGTNVLAGNNIIKINQYINKITLNTWKKSSIPKKWDGKTSNRIVKIINSLKKNDQ
ncbi:UDP-N-acetylglucosamine 2-epimerase (non-hydrolyzing) [Pelagibacteraceae bacterium]|nr:UDP-N-acetylglucosamine 2-epimerase (non-hydrolyzing) [Pelagibacteraceae bacterium]